MRKVERDIFPIACLERGAAFARSGRGAHVAKVRRTDPAGRRKAKTGAGTDEEKGVNGQVPGPEPGRDLEGAMKLDNNDEQRSDSYEREQV